MANLRAGLVGAGMMGRHHARVLGSLDGVDLVGIVDPDGDKHGVSGGRPVVDTVEALVELGIDYAVVAVPTAFHLEVGLTLADAGVHALVEKPLAEGVEVAAQLAEAFEDKGLVGGVGHIERYNPALQSARTRIASGDLGDVYQVATRRQGPFPGRIADVGVVMDLATHDIDLTAWVTQQSYVSIAGQTAHRSGRPHEDLVAATGLLSQGTVVNHLVNWLSPLKERTTIITGEKGTLVADTLTADLTFYENGKVATTWEGLSQFRGVSEGDVHRYAIPKPEPLRIEHEDFRDAVLGKDADIVTLQQGLATVKVAQTCLESARTSQTITL
ncbi:Gfo/Idh/MocA family oxidoreductase [Janibacter terrae]|uniref:Gfo/Idh/MocA family oxidoreductase n=1 Tax=Janibacter terrae TaxID=103817 RepID=A0ABZ2FFU1_9MICO